jgi:hypothetical protein
MKNSLFHFICLLNFTSLINSSVIPSFQAFKTSVDGFQDIKKNLNESHSLPKSAVNKLTDQSRENIKNNNILPKGDYQESCQFCTCVGNLLSCTKCKDNPKVSKNLSYNGICSESQSITYINNFLTPTTGFFYEYLQIIELIKKAFPAQDGTMKISRSQLSADLVEQLEFTRKHLFPFIQAKNRTALLRANITAPSYKQELKERAKFHLDFDPAKELAQQKGQSYLQDQDFIRDDTLNTIYKFSNELSKFINSLDIDEKVYDEAVIDYLVDAYGDFDEPTQDKTIDSTDDDDLNETPVEGPKS